MDEGSFDKPYNISRETLHELLRHCEQVIADPALAATLFPVDGLPPELTPELIDYYVSTCTEIRDALSKALNDPFLQEETVVECSTAVLYN